jgi:hypothetical protein
MDPAPRRSSASWALVLGVAAAVAAGAAWFLFRSRGAGPEAGTTSPPSTGAETPREARLGPWRGRKEPAPPAEATGPRGTLVVHVTTLGSGLEVPVTAVRRKPVDPPSSTVEVEARANERYRLQLREPSLLPDVEVTVPDPAPPRLEVRVPAAGDPRLAEPVLEVRDAVTSGLLPLAFLDLGAAAPAEAPLKADGYGRIRIPARLATLAGERGWRDEGAVVGEPSHLPVPWTTPMAARLSLEDWASWDATGLLPIRLEPYPDGAETRRLRVVDESGRPRPSVVLLARFPGGEFHRLPPIPSRTDADGVALAPDAAATAFDAYEGDCLLGTFVLGRAARAARAAATRDLRLPSSVRVHVTISGLPGRSGSVTIRPAAVTSLDPDAATGYSRIDGKDAPGWSVFEPAEGDLLTFAGDPPVAFDRCLPKGREVSLVVTSEGMHRRAVVRVDEPKDVALSWGSMEPWDPRSTLRNVEWSTTREGLDEIERAFPGASKTPSATR